MARKDLGEAWGEASCSSRGVRYPLGGLSWSPRSWCYGFTLSIVCRKTFIDIIKETIINVNVVIFFFIII